MPGGGELVWFDPPGADHVDPVEFCLLGDLLLLALIGERVIGDVHLKVLFDLVAVPHRAHLKADLGLALQRARLDSALELTQILLGARQQLGALAGALLGHQRVAADNQPLAGIQLLARDLGQVELVEHRQLQAALLDQRSDLRRLQRGDERILCRL